MPRWIGRAVVLFWSGFLAALVVREVFHQLSGLLVLLVIALFLALAIEPGVNFLERRKWSRGLGTAAILTGTILAFAALIGLVGSLVGSQVADVLRNSDRYVSESVDFLNGNFGTKIDPAEVNDSINDPDGPVQEFIRNQQSRVFSLSIDVLGGALQVLTVLLFTFYLVADAPRMRRAICSRLAPERQRFVMDTWQMAIDKTGSYLYSRTLLAAVSTVVHWLAFEVIGSPAPLATALWVGVISQFVPVLGTYIAAVLPLLLTFLESPGQAVFVVVVIVVYQQVENYLVAPRITARTLQMHPAVAFASAIAGAALLGAVGAVLALPAAAMIQSVVSEWGRRHEVVVDTTHRRRTTGRTPAKKAKKAKRTRTAAKSAAGNETTRRAN
jgi:predicted PurR-regulated permease PerM